MHVYISGPYTKGDPVLNVHEAIRAAEAVIDAGHIPFIPHLCHLWHTISPHDYKFWMAFDLAWLPKCDVLIRLPGESSGSNQEVARAQELGIPVLLMPRNAQLLGGGEEWIRRELEKVAA